jgi:exo-beta-1,3-glucanase (GH17 family)
MNTIGRFLLVVVFLFFTSLQAIASDVKYKVIGLNFSPYMDGQSPNWQTQISQTQLLDRMKIIQPYTQWIRTFGSNDGLERSGAVAHSLGLKAALSAWISSDLNANETQITNLIAAAKRGEADLLIVGSEVLLRGDISEAKLIDYINRVKQAVSGIPVTTSDVYSEIISHQNLRDVCDVLFVNLYPYWEGISIDSAIAFLDDRYEQVKEVANGKLVVVSETGWPSAGNPVGNSVPTPQNASRYFLDFILWAQKNNVYYLYFEAFDQTWKADAEGQQGANWGVWDKNGNLKPGMNAVFSSTECLFNWAEINYPTLLAPAGSPTAAWTVYTYRYYSATNAYLVFLLPTIMFITRV